MLAIITAIQQIRHHLRGYRKNESLPYNEVFSDYQLHQYAANFQRFAE
jgi:hypothetical protein